MYKRQGSRRWADPAAAEGTRGGVLARLANGRGAPPGPKPVDIRGCSTSCCCCTPACPGGDAVPRRLHSRGHRRARQGRGGRGRAHGLDRVSPLCRTPLKKSAGRRPSRQQGLLRSLCRPRWVRRKPKRNRCRLQAKPARGRDSDRRLRRIQKHLPTTQFVKALARWATGNRLTDRLPKLSLITPCLLYTSPSPRD